MDFINRIIYALTELHPLHPMLVHFPIGLTGAGAFFILIAVWKREAVFERAAYYNNSLAIAATLLAGLAGLYDNKLNYNGEAPNAILKILLASVLLFATSLLSYFRWQTPNLFNSQARIYYIAVYLFNFVLALMLAFLGGVILYGF